MAAPASPATTTESFRPRDPRRGHRRCFRPAAISHAPGARGGAGLYLAYGAGPEEIARWRRGLGRVAKLLATGDRAQACTQAVQLAFPEIAPDGMAKLAQAATLRKYNPNWPAEPRVPRGNPGGGDWTTDGAAGGADPDIQPAAAPMNPVQAMKERFVDAHIADAQKVADELGIPVENILGLSALESDWSRRRFAAQGNNYFGINYPAPYANRYMLSLDGGAKFATFTSCADCLKSFAAISGSLVRGKSDPEAFATASQNSGKFGIYDNGAKVKTYVKSVAATIRGLRAIVGQRKI